MGQPDENVANLFVDQEADVNDVKEKEGDEPVKEEPLVTVSDFDLKTARLHRELDELRGDRLESDIPIRNPMDPYWAKRDELQLHLHSAKGN